MIHRTTHCFSSLKTKDQLNNPHTVFQSRLIVISSSPSGRARSWRRPVGRSCIHPTQRMSKNVGISSEDEAEGMEATPGVTRRGSGRPAAPEPQPAPAPAPLQVTADEVVVKKRALKRMKQQVLALLRGKDLPGGDQARETAEVPYDVPSVPRGETTCPICKKVFKTHHRAQVHMGMSTGVRNSHVVRVGRCWLRGDTGLNTPSHVFMVRGLHALCAGNCSWVLRPCTSTIKLNMELTL